jgi:hypothetical protein
VKTQTSSTPKPQFTHQMADEEKSMPLGVGEPAADDAVLDPLAGATESRKFRSSSLIVVVVVVIACGGLWFMRSLSHVAGATGVKSDVEQTIEKFLGTRDTKGNAKSPNGTDPNVLAVLSESFTKDQVPLENVQRDPFVLPGEGDMLPTTPVITGDSPERVLARARQTRQREIDETASRLSLKSIIMGHNPLANISGTIVRLGDEIAPEGSEVTFKVSAITSDSVLLVSEDLALGMHVEVPLSMKRDQ